MNWCKTFIIFSAAALAANLASSSTPAVAQTFQNYRCADGSQFIVGFFPYDRRAQLKITKAGTTVKHGKRPATACEQT